MINLLVLLTKREPPSSRLRFCNCKKEFSKNNIEVEFDPIPSGPVKRFKLFLKCKDFDAVIIQKKTSFREFELFFMKLLNTNIIFDFDDAVMFHELDHDRPLTGKNVIKFIRTVKYCKAVVAGNKFLAEFARPNCSSVHVLPTPVDIKNYKTKDYSLKKRKIFIGWIGVSGNLKYLEIIRPVLKEITVKHKNVSLKIISNASVNMDGVRIEFRKWKNDEEVDDLRSLDIGIMPLDDSLWTRGKCGYKILQYMGVGLPVVASPVGINVELINHGESGLLSATSEEWSENLDLLIKNPDKRKKMGLKGRQIVEDRYCVEKYSSEYSEVIKGILTQSESI